MQNSERSRQTGGVYVLVLLSVALVGALLASTAQLWSATQRSHRIAELDWVGEQYRHAIGSYYEASPGAVKNYPASLQDLVLDKRYLSMRRHLRQIYSNPVSGRYDWVEIPAAQGGIKGIRAAVPTQHDREFVYTPQAKAPANPFIPRR